MSPVLGQVEGSDGWGDLDFDVGTAALSGTATVMQFNVALLFLRSRYWIFGERSSEGLNEFTQHISSIR